jgi:hypothetical protein|tara:strand:- start:271 stop:1404 length:1134 start_codon:yes stop_codon:yes gene_type:complete
MAMDKIYHGQIKLGLIQRGITVPSILQGLSEVAGGLCSGEPGEEITLALGEDFIVKANLNASGQDGPKLVSHGDRLRLHMREGEIDVGIITIPEFLKQQLKQRTPVSENICLDGYCLNIFLRAIGRGKKLSMPIEAILSVIQSAFEEGAADLVQLNMDFCEEPDRGFDRLAPLVTAIKKRFNTFVALKGFPPTNSGTIDLMYASGFDIIDFPLGGFSGTVKSKRKMTAKQVYSALEYAAGVFPPGTVWTDIVLGTDPISQCKEGVDRLTDSGIIPLIYLERDSSEDLDGYRNLVELAEHMDRAIQRNRLPLKWLYPTCRFLSPLDTRFFTEDPLLARLAVTPVYRSGLGRKTSAGFAALRRKLRIRNVSDSFESAGL